MAEYVDGTTRNQSRADSIARERGTTMYTLTFIAGFAVGVVVVFTWGWIMAIKEEEPEEDGY